MQAALDQLWPYALQLFATLPDEQLLAQAGYFPHSDELCESWQAVVIPYLQEVDLNVVSEGPPITTTRTEHSIHLGQLLNSLQEVARSYPDAGW